MIGSLACGDSDSGGGSSDASDELACSPAPCPVVGGWQLGGGEFMCTGGNCNQVISPCGPGAIRFDPSGALFRLTSAGWETACGFAACGDRVTGARLSNILTADYAATPGDPSGRCGPDWDVLIVAGAVDAGASNLATCSLNAYAPCAGGATRSDNPPGVAPWSVQVAYSRCVP